MYGDEDIDTKIRINSVYGIIAIYQLWQIIKNEIIKYRTVLF